MILLIQYTLLFASVLMLVALGGCFSEHSGVINLGLEGIMVMGALGGALVMKYLPAGTSAFVIVLLVILASMLMGLIYSSLLGVAGVNFSADQTLVGTAMNMLAAALATVIVKSINVAENPDNVSSTVQYVQAKKALIVNVGGFQFNWFMLVAVILLFASHFILYKTRFGLRLMACGEHPAAAGIVYITAGVSEWKFETGVAGFGFLALAVMIFGQWKPVNIAGAALLFGFFRALSNVYSGFPFLAALKIPGSIYNMMPYLISLIVLALTSKNSRAPKAEGIPYDKSRR